MIIARKVAKPPREKHFAPLRLCEKQKKTLRFSVFARNKKKTLRFSVFARNKKLCALASLREIKKI